MSLKDHALPGGHGYMKLSAIPDGEEIDVIGMCIIESKYGPQPCIIEKDGTYITLPGRYQSYVEEVMEDVDSMEELGEGVTIRKDSYEYAPGKSTPTFKYV